jgi:hypothetical protein
VSDSDFNRTHYSRAVAAIIAASVLVTAVLITLLIKTASSDSAEQLLWAQNWRLGYGIQPPLYSWLQLGFFKVFGVNLGSIIFLKEILIGIAAWLTYLAVREMTKDEKIAALATASLLLMPEFSYESHRNLSHSLLTMALAAATLYIMVRMALETEAVPDLYAWLGIIVGAGLLSKYNFGSFFFACCAAAVSLPETRRIVLNRWMLLTAALAALIFTPHAVWLANHLNEGLSDKMAYKLHPEAQHGWLASVGDGVWFLFSMSIGMFVLPLLGVYAIGLLLWRKQKIPLPPEGRLWARYLSRLLGWEAVVVAVLILVFRVTGFQSRWLLPWLFVLPPCVVLACRERITPPMRRFVLAIALTCGVVAVLVFVFGNQIAHMTRHYHGADVPFEQLADKVRAEGFNRGTVVSDEHWYVGNLRLYFPGAVCTTPVFRGPVAPAGEPLLIVWSGAQMPKALQEFVKQEWPHLRERFTARSFPVNYRDSDKPALTFHYVIADVTAK